MNFPVKLHVSCPEKLDPTNVALMMFTHMRTHLILVKERSLARFTLHLFTAIFVNFHVLAQVVGVAESQATLVAGGHFEL